MNTLDRKARTQILGMMVEGMSKLSITRLTGASKTTVAKLLKDAGEACWHPFDDPSIASDGRWHIGSPLVDG